ncbi:MAG TPA: hypothetical protein VK203_20065 [Nostocaceae cyanobacterium]|nr:hypothetical protein [Nostocaceae cyanobacterium]
MLKYQQYPNPLIKTELALGKSIQKNFCHFLIISSVTTLGIGSLASISQAGTATLNASYNVQFECNFSNSTYSNTSPGLEYSNGIVSGLIWSGKLAITCNHGGKVVISTSAPAVSSAVTSLRNLSTYYGEYLRIYDNTAAAYIWKNGNNYSASPSITLSPSSSIYYEIYMYTNPPKSGQILPNGNYSYSFTLTATPN